MNWKDPGLWLAAFVGASVRVVIEVAPLALFIYLLHELQRTFWNWETLAWVVAFVAFGVMRDMAKRQ